MLVKKVWITFLQAGEETVWSPNLSAFLCGKYTMLILEVVTHVGACVAGVCTLGRTY